MQKLVNALIPAMLGLAITGLLGLYAQVQVIERDQTGDRRELDKLDAARSRLEVAVARVEERVGRCQP